MTITSPIKKISNGIKDKAYDTARVLTRLAYTLIPTGAYIASSEKLSEVENMFFIKRWLANLFYKGDIEKLNQFNDYSAKGIGIAGGLLLGHFIDRTTGKMLPNSPNFRKLSQIAGYFSLANLANLIANRRENLQDITLETILSNAQGTLNHALDTAINITQLDKSSDADYIMSSGIMALTGLATFKLADYLIRSPLAKAAGNLVKSVYNNTIGAEDDAYKHRLANRIQIKKAKKEIKNS